MSKKIYLSPSNQSDNTYATGNTNEMAQCDKIAAATQTALRRCGFEVKTGKSGDTMANRCAESDKFGADIHMPIHTNACNGKVTGGTRIFCYSSSAKNANPAKAVLKTLGPLSPGTADSVSYNQEWYEIYKPKAVTVYVEVEFHDTKTGSNWIRNNTANIGEAICKGLCNYFGVAYKAANSSTAKVLDKKGWQKGDWNSGIYALKTMLYILFKMGIQPYKFDDNGKFCANTEKAVKFLQKRWGYEQTGVVANNFLKKLGAEIRKKL